MADMSTDPQRWYHGTLADRAQAIRETGFQPDARTGDLWFTSSPAEASRYTDRHQVGASGDVVAAELQYRNPFVIDRTTPEPYTTGFSPYLKGRLQEAGIEFPESVDWVTALRDQGHDAIEYRHPDRTDIQLWDSALTRVSRSSSFSLDVPTTEQALAAILSSPLPPLPPQEQRLGSCQVSWLEQSPGEVFIHAEGGTPHDRYYASTVLALDLEPHGYKRAQFDMDEGTWSGPLVRTAEARTSSWVNVMTKAKRLLDSGQVQLGSNGFEYVIGHVIGDHGNYECDFSREDPNSRAVTQWSCTCPWDQYAWQRTRKWKKYEGRPCSHVTALYWKSLSTPLDGPLTEEQAERLGPGQAIGPGGLGAPKPKGPSDAEGLPRSFGPEGDIIQGDQMQIPFRGGPDGIGGPPGPAQAPLAPPPGAGGPQGTGPAPAGIIPPFPAQEGTEMLWAGPGTTPGGGVSPPGAVSVPGAKPQTFMNPLQGPNTYSKVAADFNPPEIVRLKKPMYGIAEGPVQGQYGDGGYREVPAGSTGEVLSQDQSTGWIEIIVPLDDSGPHEPFHVRCFVEPGDIDHTNQAPPGPFIKRRTKVAALEQWELEEQFPYLDPQHAIQAEELRNTPGNGPGFYRYTQPDGRPGMQDAVKDTAYRAGYQNIDRYNQTTEQKLNALYGPKSDAHVAVRVRHDNLGDVLTNGVRNAHDYAASGDERRPDYLEARKAAEEKVFGHSPIYGYMATPDEHITGSAAGGFGDTKLILKPHMRNATTASYSDSLFAGMDKGGVTPSSVDNPSYLSVPYFTNLSGVDQLHPNIGDEPNPLPALPPELQKERANLAKVRSGQHEWATWSDAWAEQEERLKERINMWKEELRDKGEWNPWNHGDFVEAQIHQPVRPEDIDAIVSPHPITPEIQQHIERLHVPYFHFQEPDLPSKVEPA